MAFGDNVLLTLLALLSILHLTFAQAPLGGGVDDINLRPVTPRSSLGLRRGRTRCNPFFREVDGTCTNDRDKETMFWGSTGRAQNSYIHRRGTSQVIGKRLRSTREISNILSAQHVNIFDERRLAEITTFFGQFIDHTFAATPLSEESFGIPLRQEDSVARDRARLFGNASALPFHRSVRTKAERRDFVERPMNSLGSAVDLTNVYGPSETRLNHLRSSNDSMMRVSDDGQNLLPKNTDDFNNAPSRSPNFFLAGDHRSNEHPVLTALHTVFLREHNSIVRDITKDFKDTKTSEEIFQIAKRINEAQFQRIVYEEWFTAVTGRNFPGYRGYREDVDSTLTTEFTTAAFRFGHTMVGNEVNRKGPGNVRLGSRSLLETFFQVVDIIENEGIDNFLRGAITSRAQKVDLSVVDALRSSLFAGVENEEVNFDLIALNLQRGRDHAIANYNGLRRRFCCPKAVSFSDISSDPSVQSRLQTAYSSVDRVEAWPGLVAEDHPPGSSVGPTLSGLLRVELTRVRNGDRFFYKREESWPADVLRLPRVSRIVRAKNLDLFREILLRNTDIAPEDLPRRMFFVD